MGFLDDLARVAQDPEVRRLARRRAGSRELAEDALQETYLAVARARQPESIRDLRAFFRTSLIHEIDHQLARPNPRPVDGIAATADLTDGRAPLHAHTGASVEDEVGWRLLAETLRTRLDHEREQLTASVPGRSADQNMYRSAMTAAAGKILNLLLQGHVGRGDWNAILKQECPQWCDEPGIPHGTIDQRLSRARYDVQFLLKELITPDELSAVRSG
jgi:hypothetical protein